MKSLKLSLVFFLSFASLSLFSQSNIVEQSFEGSGSWTYTSLPNPYTVYNPPTDIWGICGTSYSSTSSNPQVYGYADVVAPFLAGITTASDGNHYWGVQDITNPYSDTVWTNGSIRDSATLANLNVQNIPSFPVFGSPNNSLFTVSKKAKSLFRINLPAIELSYINAKWYFAKFFL